MKLPFPNIRTLKNKESSPDILVRDSLGVYQYFHCNSKSSFRNALPPPLPPVSSLVLLSNFFSNFRLMFALLRTGEKNEGYHLPLGH